MQVSDTLHIKRYQYLNLVIWNYTKIKKLESYVRVCKLDYKNVIYRPLK